MDHGAGGSAALVVDDGDVVARSRSRALPDAPEVRAAIESVLPG